MAKKELPGIDGATKEFIEGQVKKGKARKFFIIYKGADIRTLVVFKKGPFGPKMMEAKKAGFLGDKLCGIVTGSGQHLTFYLAGNIDVATAMKVDTCVEEAPFAVPKFRKFFADNDMKFKPDFEVVVNPDMVPGVDEDDDENATVAPAPAAQPTARPTQPSQEVANEPPPSPSPVETSSAAKAQTLGADVPEGPPRADAIQQRFEALQPRLASALATHPDEADDLNDLVAEFNESMKIHDLDVAEEWLDKLTGAIDELPAAAPDIGMADFEARLKQLAPIAVPIAKAGEEQGTRIMSLLKQAQIQRTAGDRAGGMATLDEIERTMQTPATATAVTGESPENLAEKFRARFASLVPQIKAGAGTVPGDDAKRLAGEAAAAAKSNNYSQANDLLDQAERNLRLNVGRNAPPPVGHILGIWREAKEEVDDQIDQLTRTLKKSQHPFLRQVAELGLIGLAEDPSQVYVGMMTSLFDFQSATTDKRAKAGTKVKESIKKYREFLASSRVLEVFDTDPLCGPTTIRDTLSGAMAKMEVEINEAVS